MDDFHFNSQQVMNYVDKTNNLVTSSEEVKLEVDCKTPLIAVGQWYWYTTTNHKNEELLYFMCVTHIGSNYIQLKTPSLKNDGEMHTRVLFTDMVKCLKLEENHQKVINDFIQQYQNEANKALQEIKEITKRLGLSSANLIESKDTSGTGLSVLNGVNHLDDYKVALVKAKTEDLPALFELVKKANSRMASWMSAETVALNTEIDRMQSMISEIDDRVFNVSLYAGLDESAILCADGKPATIHDKLHIMQRKLYMDEECLLNYQAGGMEFNDIESFDRWISQPENRDRILPFPKTLVAMQVRRKIKDRSDDDLDVFIKVKLEYSDKFTYLYLRNGEKVYRLIFDCFDFDKNVFPNRDVYDPSEPKMIAVEHGSVKKFITKVEHDTQLAEYKLLEEKYEVWKEAEIKRKIEAGEKDLYISDYHFEFYSELKCNLFYNNYSTKYYPFDDTTVYYDDAVALMSEEIKKYNHVVLIVQGLFDRSNVLSPHLPAKTWFAEGFNQSIKLVYDEENALYAGDKPDIVAYIKKCNSQVDADSVFTGQLDYWMRKEAEKKNEAESNRYRYSSRDYITYRLYKPEGNEGMPFVSKAKKVSKDGQKITFHWFRSRLTDRRFGNYESVPSIPCQITVPLDFLFNVSAYQVGDYKQFFADPRTRQEYLKWAPFLLAAEDYHANKSKEQSDFLNKINSRGSW